MTKAHELLQKATNTVTAAECQAWRTLQHEYTEDELAFMFEVARTTVHRHVTGDCGHAED